MSKFSLPLRAATANGSAKMLRPVTPDDLVDLPDGVACGLSVSIAGNLSVMDSSANVVTLISGSAQYNPVEVCRVLATGSTAGGIVVLY